MKPEASEGGLMLRISEKLRKHQTVKRIVLNNMGGTYRTCNKNNLGFTKGEKVHEHH